MDEKGSCSLRLWLFRFSGALHCSRIKGRNQFGYPHTAKVHFYNPKFITIVVESKRRALFNRNSVSTIAVENRKHLSISNFIEHTNSMFLNYRFKFRPVVV